jgi:hypothetical protein
MSLDCCKLPKRRAPSKRHHWYPQSVGELQARRRQLQLPLFHQQVRQCFRLKPFHTLLTLLCLSSLCYCYTGVYCNAIWPRFDPVWKADGDLWFHNNAYLRDG